MQEENQTLTGENRLTTDGNYSVQNSLVSGEGIVSDKMRLGVSFSPHFEQVTVAVSYEDGENHVGALAQLSPDEARDLALRLEGLADHVEEIEPEQRSQPDKGIFNNLFR